jgi:ribosomal protein L9
MEWSRAGGEKLDQERQELHQQQQSEREQRERTAAILQKSTLESVLPFKPSTQQQKPSVSILEALGEILKDLLTD